MSLENPRGDFCMVAHSFLHEFLVGLGAAPAVLDVFWMFKDLLLHKEVLVHEL